MTHNGKPVTAGCGVTVVVPGTRYTIDTTVEEVYETHVVVKINNQLAQVPPAAILAVIDSGTLAFNQAMDNWEPS